MRIPRSRTVSRERAPPVGSSSIPRLSHRETGLTTTTTAVGNGVWNPWPLLESDDARAAIRSLGETLRAVSFVNRLGELSIDAPENGELAAFALGKPVDAGVALGVLRSPANLDALLGAGGASVHDSGEISLRFEVISDLRSMAILPFVRSSVDPELDSVYAGSDSWLLLERAWQYGLRGRHAVDLGTGTGLVAAFLTTRFPHVLGTDLNPKAAATAMLGRELNAPHVRERMSIAVNDVVSGLRPASFDFVCVNAPWVPNGKAKGRVYADGGATGFELPTRFLRDGTDLLAPDGVLVALCADLHFADGRSPLTDLLGEIRSDGFTAKIVPTPEGHPFHTSTLGASGVVPDLASADHVTVVIHRPKNHVNTQ